MTEPLPAALHVRPAVHAPVSRALGNFGNALLAQGELKKALLEELRLSFGQEGLGREAWLRLEGAEARLR